MKATKRICAASRLPKAAVWAAVGIALALRFGPHLLVGPAGAVTPSGPSDVIVAEPGAVEEFAVAGAREAGGFGMLLPPYLGKYPRMLYAHYLPSNTVASGPIREQYRRAMTAAPERLAPGPVASIHNWYWAPAGLDLTLDNSVDLDVRRAMRAGIDGFAVDVSDRLAKEVLDALFRVVETKDYPFMITACLQELPLNTEMPRAVAAVRSLLAAHGKSIKLGHRLGRPLIFGCRVVFAAGSSNKPEENWKSLAEIQGEFAKQVEQPCYYQFSLEGFLQPANQANPEATAAAGAAVALAEKTGAALAKTYPAVGAGGDASSPGELDAVARGVLQHSAEWSQPVWFQRESPTGLHVAKGTEILRDKWQRAIVLPSSLIEFSTWNDYAGNDNLAPGVDTHYSLMDLSAYFSRWWKTGQPPRSDHDRIYLTYRQYSGRAESGPSNSERAADGVLEVLTILPEPGTVRLPGRNLQYEAPAGFNVAQFPRVPGKVVAEVIRGNRVDTHLEAPQAITDLPGEGNGLVSYSTEEWRHWKADFGSAGMPLSSE